MPEFSPEFFARHDLNVSRETLGKFSLYAALLRKWQKTINLVSAATLEDLATRHFLDSAQLLPHLPGLDIRLADMGSGAGFPGMVLALLGVREVHLIESDVRKATFLRIVSRETNTPVIVHDERVEDTAIAAVDVITARALAPLRDLLALADRLATPGHAATLLFLKGEKTAEELARARKQWQFSLQTLPSRSDKSGNILKINELKKCST